MCALFLLYTGRNLILKAICPQIFGLFTVKLAGMQLYCVFLCTMMQLTLIYVLAKLITQTLKDYDIVSGVVIINMNQSFNQRLFSAATGSLKCLHLFIPFTNL
jgi:hypothetical protein